MKFGSLVLTLLMLTLALGAPSSLFSVDVKSIEQKGQPAPTPQAQPAANTKLTPAQAQFKKTGAAAEGFENFQRPSLITQAVALTALSLLPFIVMILSSFLKIVIVLSLLRNALGVQQAPP